MLNMFTNSVIYVPRCTKIKKNVKQGRRSQRYGRKTPWKFHVQSNDPVKAPTASELEAADGMLKLLRGKYYKYKKYLFHFLLLPFIINPSSHMQLIFYINYIYQIFSIYRRKRLNKHIIINNNNLNQHQKRIKYEQQKKDDFSNHSSTSLTLMTLDRIEQQIYQDHDDHQNNVNCHYSTITTNHHPSNFNYILIIYI